MELALMISGYGPLLSGLSLLYCSSNKYIIASDMLVFYTFEWNIYFFNMFFRYILFTSQVYAMHRCVRGAQIYYCIINNCIIHRIIYLN